MESKYLSGVGVAKMRKAITTGFQALRPDPLHLLLWAAPSDEKSQDSITTMKDACGLEASDVVNTTIQPYSIHRQRRCACLMH